MTDTELLAEICRTNPFAKPFDHACEALRRHYAWLEKKRKEGEL